MLAKHVRKTPPAPRLLAKKPPESLNPFKLTMRRTYNILSYCRFWPNFVLTTIRVCEYSTIRVCIMWWCGSAARTSYCPAMSYIWVCQLESPVKQLSERLVRVLATNSPTQTFVQQFWSRTCCCIQLSLGFPGTRVLNSFILQFCQKIINFPFACVRQVFN